MSKKRAQKNEMVVRVSQVPARVAPRLEGVVKNTGIKKKKKQKNK